MLVGCLLPPRRIGENGNDGIFNSPTQAKTVLTGLRGGLCYQATFLLGLGSKVTGAICRGKGEAVGGEREDRGWAKGVETVCLLVHSCPCHLLTPLSTLPQADGPRGMAAECPMGLYPSSSPSCPIFTRIPLPNPAQKLQQPHHQGTPHIEQ